MLTWVNNLDRSYLMLDDSLSIVTDVGSMMKFPKDPFCVATLTVSMMVFTVCVAAASSYFTTTLPWLQNKTEIISMCGCYSMNGLCTCESAIKIYES